MFENKPWNEMDEQEKADAFDQSYDNPTLYQKANFPDGAPAPTILPHRHRKPDGE